MSSVGYSMKGRHLGSIRDLTPEEFWRILNTAKELKLRLITGERPNILEGRTLGMIFQKPSLRTVVSFEVAMNQLGGKALYLGPDQISIGKRETTEDIAIVLSGFVDGIMARVFGHDIIEDLVKYSQKPVINGLSDYEHPCQILGDFLTVWENKNQLKGLKMAYIGDGNNVANSLAFGSALMGMNMVVASPKGFELDSSVMELAAQDAAKFNTGGTVEQVNDPIAAVKDADIVYTDVWASMGQEAEKAERLKLFEGFMVDEAMMAHARPDSLLMHCLPAHYGEEIAPGMNRHPRTVFYPQAENRLHAQKAVLALTIR